jgi:hypothetical protein
MTHLVLAAALALARPALGADAKIAFVGTYHFANPGKDQFNVKAVDVLAPERQRQVEAIVDALARFEPTQVAVEWPKQRADERYAQYLAGTLAESRNEVVQVGFRLAKRMKLERVHGIDVDGEFPYGPVAEWSEAHGRKGELEAGHGLIASEVARYQALQEQGTIASALRAMNEPATLLKLHGLYVDMLRLGSGDEQPGANLVVAWYKRNLETCARLLQLAGPGERVVVVFGQGHAYLLRQCVREASGVELVEANALLP